MRTIMMMGLLLTAASPAAANTFGEDSFRDAKTGYRVDVAHAGDTMLLDGYNARSHGRFHLRVSPKGTVSGVFEGRPVNFVVGAPSGQSDEVAVNTAN